MTLKHKIHNLLHPKVGEVWMLHRVVEWRSDKPEQRELEVTPQWLEAQIADRQRQGYRFVGLDDLGQSRRWICITLDDGYTDTYTLAYPLLKRLNVPFAVYVTTGFIDNRLPMWWYPGEQLGMSAEELKALDANPLCTIGAHTVSHPKLDTLSCKQQYHEIAESKQTLEALLGHEIKHFSFPHGTHNDDTLAICRQLGFNTVALSWGGSIRRGDSLIPIKRIKKSQN